MKSVIIVAAGASERFGKNKLNQQILEKSVLQCSVDAFFGVAEEIIVVGDYDISGVKCVSGGSTRSQSVKNGLAAVSENCTLVAVHDGARPFVSKQLTELLFCEAEKYGSAVPKLPVTDTLWQNADVLSRQNRENFFVVQTPQVFDFRKLSHAFENAKGGYTDESALFFDTYGDVHFVEGQFSNKKITVPQDLPTFRVGAGYDVHPFGEGDGVILGGVKIPYNKKLVGHSDADVLAHAICDAVLSASGNRDIGVQFPDTDSKYLGANSLNLLSDCVRLAAKNGFVVENVSAVVICQQPKIAPHIDRMAANLAKVLGVRECCVNLSATTTERLGSLGNGDGIAAEATALLCKKL